MSEEKESYEEAAPTGARVAPTIAKATETRIETASHMDNPLLSEPNVPLFSLLPKKIPRERGDNGREKTARKKNLSVGEAGGPTTTTSASGYPPSKKKVPQKGNPGSTEKSNQVSVSTRILEWFHAHNKPVTPQVLMNELGSQFSKVVIQKNLEMLYQEEKKLSVKDFKKIRIYYLTPGSGMEEEAEESGKAETSKETSETRTTTEKREGEVLPHRAPAIKEESPSKKLPEHTESGVKAGKGRREEEEEGNDRASWSSSSSSSLLREGRIAKGGVEAERNVEGKGNGAPRRSQEGREAQEVAVGAMGGSAAKWEGTASTELVSACLASEGGDAGTEMARSNGPPEQEPTSSSSVWLPTSTTGTSTAIAHPSPILEESDRTECVKRLLELHQQVEDLETQVRSWGTSPPGLPSSLAASVELQGKLQQEIETLLHVLKGEEVEKERMKTAPHVEKKIPACMRSPHQGPPMGKVFRKEWNNEGGEDDNDPAARDLVLFTALAQKYCEARKRWRERKEYVQRLVDQMRSGSGASLCISADALYHLYGIVTDEMAGVSWKESAVEWRM